MGQLIVVSDNRGLSELQGLSLVQVKNETLCLSHLAIDLLFDDFIDLLLLNCLAIS